jgi:hypothetical protein
MSNFARARGLGKWGEKHVIAHLRANPVIEEVEDVSEIEKWQKQGVDIVYTLADGQGSQVTADIKMDRMIARTGNLFLETMSSEKVMGNMVTSSADYFLYLDPFGCKLYTIERKKILDFWLANQESLPVKQVGNKERITKGFLIKTDDIVSKGLATVEDIYVEGAKNNKIDPPAAKEIALPF